MGNTFVSLDAGVLMPSDAAFLGLGIPGGGTVAPVLVVSPSTASITDATETLAITATLSNSSASLTASLSGAGSISTESPTSGVPFTYTPPSTGIGFATVTVTDTTDGLSQPCVIRYLTGAGIINVTLAETFLGAIQARSADCAIQITSDISLLSKTVQVVIVSPIGTRQIVSVTVSSDGTYATLITTATTFQASGVYNLQLEIVNSDGTTTNAAVITLVVAASL
jgi:hypothetical protein